MKTHETKYMTVTAALLAPAHGIITLRAQNPIPIPPQPDALPVPEFIGRLAVPKPVSALPIPPNPNMGQSPWNNAHDDTCMSGTYPPLVPGPLGRSPTVFSAFLGSTQDVFALPAIMIFDTSVNRLIAAAATANNADGSAQVRLKLLDPDTLATIATFGLPKEYLASSDRRPAGTYFFTDKQNRTLIGTVERTIWVVTHDASSFSHDPATGVWDLSRVIGDTDAIQALQPDWSGRLWFTSKGGVVGTLDMATGQVLGTLQLPGERIVNGHAADEDGGVYIVSTRTMYRFDADESGAPKVTWRETYDAGTHQKPGQVDIGSGTTPTLMGREYVTITDNGQPQMHVLVYQRGKDITGPRLVCAMPVFQSGQASNENSLIATGKSIIVENNFGYKDAYKDTTQGHTTKPGIARIDLDENGGCHTVWVNESVSIPSVVSKMSLANGLIYTYTKLKGPATTDPWYFTAIDFETGATVFQRLAGTGLGFNNHYAGAYLGPNGTALRRCRGRHRRHARYLLRDESPHPPCAGLASQSNSPTWCCSSCRPPPTSCAGKSSALRAAFPRFETRN